MAEKFYLQWNIVNWITVVVMVFLAMLLLGAIASGARQVSQRMDQATDD